MEELKSCSKCGVFKLLNKDNFYVRKKGSKDGFRNNCKKCMDRQSTIYYNKNFETIQEYKKAHGEKYYKENKGKISQYSKQHYIENKERIDSVSLAWRIKNREKINIKSRKDYHENIERERERSANYYQENREKIALYFKQYGENNKSKISSYGKKYRKENPEKQRLYDHQRRARKRNLPYTMTTKEWEEILNHFNNSCAYCGKTMDEHIKKYNQQLHRDHFVALTKGGEYSINNMIPACLKCNLEKHTKDFFEWYPKYEHYSKFREKYILDFLGYNKNNSQQLSIII